MFKINNNDETNGNWKLYPTHMYAIYMKLFLIKNLPLDGVGKSNDLTKSPVILSDIAKLITQHFIKLQFPNIIIFHPNLFNYIHHSFYITSVIHKNVDSADFYNMAVCPYNRILNVKMRVTLNDIIIGIARRLSVEKNSTNTNLCNCCSIFKKYHYLEIIDMKNPHLAITNLDDTIIIFHDNNCNMKFPTYSGKHEDYVPIHPGIEIQRIESIEFNFPLTLRDLCEFYLLLNCCKNSPYAETRTQVDAHIKFLHKQKKINICFYYEEVSQI